MPAEHLIKDDDDFEEDTLFDQAGLLTNKIKKSPDIHNVHSTMRITPMKTFALCLAFFGLGISYSILEPTLLDLQYLSQADFQQIFYTISGRAVGSILGLILGMILFDRYNRQFLLFLSMLAMTVFLGVMPWCSNLVAYVMIMVILGALMQLLYAGGNVLCLDLWGRQSGPFLQAIHFSLSVGLFIAPLLSTTITSGKSGLSTSVMPDRVILNNSLLLSLPASALYSVHFRLPSLQSRHRRSISELNDTYLTSTVFSNITTTISVPLNVTFSVENRTLADQNLEVNMTTILPLNATDGNSTLVYATTVYNGNSTVVSQTFTSAANGTGSVPRKPKPKPDATKGQYLKNNDKWERSRKPSDDKPVSKLSPQVVAPSLNKVATTASTNATASIGNVNRTDYGLFNMSTMTPVENYTDVQGGVNDTNVSSLSNEKSHGNKDEDTFTTKEDIGQPVAAHVRDNSSVHASGLLLNNDTDGDYANETDNGSQSGAKHSATNLQQVGTSNTTSKDENSEMTLEPEVTSAVTLFNKAITANITLPDTVQSSPLLNSEKVETAIVNDTNSPSTVMNKQAELSTGKEENSGGTLINGSLLTTEMTTVSMEHNSTKDVFEIEQPTATQTVHISTTERVVDLADSSSWERTNDPSLITKLPPPSSNMTKSDSSLDDDSPVLKVVHSGKTAGLSNCSLYKVVNESQEKAEHHKKPNTFNNQTEESQLLLSELLSQITAMGMTKVHIVYAVMAIIVFLTSLVFLSFLCQNPRELRSKQEEGVKPGIPESKFTSIMVGLTFVLMIFYTMAHLIFSQLYLSLVLQESVHLLHSRGSLLISVFWGIYTFSRATSICCTNGFKPVTMLLLDFACCIVSAATLSFIGSHVESVLWCSVAVMSIGLSSIFPYCLLWLEDYIHISNRNMCIMLMGGSAVDLILSLTFGHSISLSSATVMYLVLVSCIFALLIFGIMWRLATWRGDKFGFSKADTQYHLASQIDEEEDNIEFPSGNSSLYLLNGGTHFPLSSWDRKNGNSYIPLQHNNTVKWK